MRIASLFDRSGNILKPWAEAGHECWAFDIQHVGHFKGHDEIWRSGIDFMRETVDPEGWDFVAAFPPCDHLAVSGARWFRGKGLRKLSDAIKLFAVAAEFCEESCAPYFIENPVSTISTYWRKPDYTFHPWEYAGWWGDDHYTKKTCLWTGGGFVMPEKRPCPFTLESPDDRIHKAAPGPDRANIRSVTPMGFARAVFESNSRLRRAA